MNCTGKRCIMQFDKVDPATCKCVSYCPEATPPMMDVDSAVVLCTLLHCLISMMPDIGPITRNHLFELLSQVEDGICKHADKEE